MSGINGYISNKTFKIKSDKHDTMLNCASRFSATLDKVNRLNDKALPGSKNWPEDLFGITEEDYNGMREIQKTVPGFMNYNFKK